MKDPAVLFYISDWLTSTSEMDADTRGWYLNLLLHNYDKGSLPNDMEKLAVLAGVKFSEYKRFEQVFEQVFKHKFEQNDEQRLSNPRTNEILRQREIFKDKRSESGKLSYFLKFCRAKHSKSMTKPFVIFVKENIDFTDVDLKNEQMLEHLFKHLFELYRNENENGNGNKNEDRNGNTLLSDLEKLDYLTEYEKITIEFWKLFKENILSVGGSVEQIGRAKYNNWVTPIRLMMTEDKITLEQLQTVYKSLNPSMSGHSKFWVGACQSTDFLRNNFNKIIAESNKQTRQNNSNTTDDRRSNLEKLQQNALKIIEYGSNTGL